MGFLDKLFGSKQEEEQTMTNLNIGIITKVEQIYQDIIDLIDVLRSCTKNEMIGDDKWRKSQDIIISQ